MITNINPRQAMQSLERDYLRIIRWIGLAMCLLIALAPSIVFGVLWSVAWYWALLAWMLLAALLYVSLNSYLKHWYLNYKYHLNTDCLAIRRGVFWRHQIAVPVSRVQHVDVNSGPLDRRYGLAKLVVNTAGTHYAQTSLPGLTVDVAHRLRDQLLASQEGDTV
ncbi:MAG: PH domain-containing protein [Marinicella pacifica]